MILLVLIPIAAGVGWFTMSMLAKMLNYIAERGYFSE
jgi:hypothetical protein